YIRCLRVLSRLFHVRVIVLLFAVQPSPATYTLSLHDALPISVGDGAKNLRAKQPVTLGLKRAVVDGLGLGDFAVGPRANFFRTCQTDADGIEISNQAGAIIRAAAIQGCFLPP